MKKNPEYQTEFEIDINIESELWNSVYQIEDKLREAVIKTVLTNDFCNKLKFFEVCIVLSDDNSVMKLNSKYRGIEKPTNVLSFPDEDLNPYEEDYTDEESLCAGGIILAYEKIFLESEQQSKDFISHAMHLAVHGVLHLLGYNHEDDREAEIMEDIEIKVLNFLDIDNPY